MLSIKNLQVSVLDKEATVDALNLPAAAKPILRGVDLDFEPGKVYAIMGPNGSGKSTLSHVLTGKPGYEVKADAVTFQGQDLLAMPPEARVAAGLFLAFQYPVTIPGVSNLQFLKTAVNAVRAQRQQPALDAVEIIKQARQRASEVGLDERFLKRAVNDDFSGGEKKRNEIIQMLMLDPCLIILDEVDSGLDVDALRLVADTINGLRSPERTVVMITHYPRLLTQIAPDVVYVMQAGRVVAQGDITLAHTIEAQGYEAIAAGAQPSQSETKS